MKNSIVVMSFLFFLLAGCGSGYSATESSKLSFVDSATMPVEPTQTEVIANAYDECKNYSSGTVTCRIQNAYCSYQPDVSGSPTFCNDAPYPGNDFTYLVWGSDVSNLDGHCIIVYGEIQYYEGKPQISWNSNGGFIEYCDTSSLNKTEIQPSFSEKTPTVDFINSRRDLGITAEELMTAFNNYGFEFEYIENPDTKEGRYQGRHYAATINFASYNGNVVYADYSIYLDSVSGDDSDPPGLGELAYVILGNQFTEQYYDPWIMDKPSPATMCFDGYVIDRQKNEDYSAISLSISLQESVDDC